MVDLKKNVALVTGAAGFIGFHIALNLLNEGWYVVGLDCLSDYYDVSLKKHRESILLLNPCYLSINEKVEEPNLLMKILTQNTSLSQTINFLMKFYLITSIDQFVFVA